MNCSRKLERVHLIVWFRSWYHREAISARSTMISSDQSSRTFTRHSLHSHLNLSEFEICYQRPGSHSIIVIIMANIQLVESTYSSLYHTNSITRKMFRTGSSTGAPLLKHHPGKSKNTMKECEVVEITTDISVRFETVCFVSRHLQGEQSTQQTRSRDRRR